MKTAKEWLVIWNDEAAVMVNRIMGPLGRGLAPDTSGKTWDDQMLEYVRAVQADAAADMRERAAKRLLAWDTGSIGREAAATIRATPLEAP